jgi:hypothetical protein
MDFNFFTLEVFEKSYTEEFGAAFNFGCSSVAAR